mgnify:CR=1 FL=1
MPCYNSAGGHACSNAAGFFMKVGMPAAQHAARLAKSSMKELWLVVRVCSRAPSSMAGSNVPACSTPPCCPACHTLQCPASMFSAPLSPPLQACATQQTTLLCQLEGSKRYLRLCLIYSRHVLSGGMTSSSSAAVHTCAGGQCLGSVPAVSDDRGLSLAPSYSSVRCIISLSQA